MKTKTAQSTAAAKIARRDRIVLEHLPLVKAIAVRVHENLPVHVDLDDLVHAGVLGLFDAASKFNPEKQVAFSSYAKHRIKGAILEELQQSFRSVLGETGWKISEDPADADRQSLLFAYPLGLEADLYGLGTYVRPIVRLEFGCRGDVWPSEQKSIQPYIADALPGLLARPTTEVHVLRPERTFWEKATLLHAVFHSGKMPPRLSRHHYDLSRLYRHDYGRLAIKDVDLLASVVEHKKVFFREAGARYDLARPGTLRVCPPDSHVAQIRSDYRDMREMFFSEPPPFDTVMADLRERQARDPSN